MRVKYWVAAAAVLALAGCGDDQTPAEKAAADAAAVAEVEAAQAVPAERLVPEPITFATIEKYGLFGAGCNFFVPGQTEDQLPLALLMADGGAIMRKSSIHRFAPDKGSAQGPLGSWRKYDGKAYSMTIEFTGPATEDTSIEGATFPARLTIRDGGDRNVYEAEGTAACGA